MVKNTEIYELIKEKIEKKFVVPNNIKDKVWHEIEIDKNGLILNERRPHFRNPKIITKLPIFKLKYNLQNKTWTVFWMRANGKWNSLKTYKQLNKILDFIENNGEYFWG